jgi:hypothetical protein
VRNYSSPCGLVDVDQRDDDAHDDGVQDQADDVRA